MNILRDSLAFEFIVKRRTSTSHLGLGDVRITLAEQDDIVRRAGLADAAIDWMLKELINLNPSGAKHYQKVAERNVVGPL